VGVGGRGKREGRILRGWYMVDGVHIFIAKKIRNLLQLL
jgi:hypothetical protein